MRFTLLLVFTLSVSVSVYGQQTDFEEIDFKKADSIANLNKGASLENLPVLTHKLTAYLTTDVEKFRAIYTWVSTNIENDYSSYLKTRKKRKKLANDREAYLVWNNDFTPKVFENLIKHRKTACTGYAYLLREMATLADIKCEIVNGFGRTPTLMLTKNSIPNHSWNAVELNSKWYLCDPTWSAGRIVLEEDIPLFEPDYFDGYFLADPEFFIRNHYPLEINFSLLKEPPTFQDFIEGPVVYKEAFSNAVIPVSPSKMMLNIKKQDTMRFSLKVATKATNNSFSILLVRGGNQKEVKPKITRDKTIITLGHAFQNSGVHDVHITYKNEIIATYVVKTKRN